MNLERVSNEEKLNLCRKYYLGGFAFLPFLWLVNIFWFFREAFLVPAYTEQSQIKGCESRAQIKGGHQVWEKGTWEPRWEGMMGVPEFWNSVEEKREPILWRPESRWKPTFPLLFPLTDVWRSAVGFLFWVIILTTWITIFQIYRPRWGALGDYLSFTIPLGTP
uniref:Gamma-secretase subunit PEN-2 n=1 Tax=Sus scrofa TaxID=9823 RepID=A0A8D0W1Q6_PIG